MTHSKLLQEGLLHLEKGEWQQAKHKLQSAYRLDKTAEVCQALAKSLWWLNQIPDLFDIRTEAYQLFFDRGDMKGAARNAAWLGIDYLELKGDFAIANGWFQRADNVLGDNEDSWEHAFIKLLKARLSFMQEQDNNTAFQLLNSSLAISEKSGFADLQMVAGALKGFILITEGRINEGMGLLDEATLLATTSGINDVNLNTITCCFLIDACERIRDYERAGQWCERVIEISKRWNFDAMFASCKNQYASVLVWKGDWENAERELLDASEVLKTSRPSHVGNSMVRLADLRRRQGKWDEASKLFDEAGAHGLKLFYSAAFSLDKEELETAADLAERYLRKIPEKEKTGRIAGTELLIRIYAKQERYSEASKLLADLSDVADQINTVPLRAAVRSAEGIVNQSQSKLDKAKQNFEDAIDLFDQIEAPFESAQNRAHLSEVLIATDQYVNAEVELEIAISLFRKLGAQKHLARTKSILKNLRNANVAINTYEFTGREIEVLRLLADGKNNEDIANQLFVSVRTVEKHLTNLYSKMGISGKSARTVAASYAIRHNIALS